MLPTEVSTRLDCCLKQQIPGANAQTVAIRQYLMNACECFIDRGLADPKFVKELTAGSSQKFWSCISEALLARCLRDKVFGERKKLGKGPDFLVMAGSSRVWIEVVCPTANGVPAEWLSSKPAVATTFPHEEILLRWTSAIKAKAEALVGTEDGKVRGYLKTGVVATDDAYVIAVNGCQLRHGPFPALFGISQFPFAAEAVFPIGPYELRIDRKSLEVVESGYRERPCVINKNGARVPAYTFLNSRFDPVSAIWAVDLRGGAVLGETEPMAVIHNPNATNPVPLGFLPAEHEYVAQVERDELVLRKFGTSGIGC